VVIGHRSVLNFIKGITDVVNFSQRDVLLSLTTISFDIFVLETFLPLSTGTKVIIGDEEQQVNALAAARVLTREAVSIFQVTPSRLQLFVGEADAAATLAPLDYLLVGGEAFPATLLQQVRKLTRGRIINQYGPTETTVWSSLKDLTGDAPLNIGKPIANTQIYILGNNNKPQPIGVYGELCIAGDGLAIGYLNRTELTAERFHDWTFTHQGKEITTTIYRTGDLARWLPDGNIDFLGRTDFQVKVRGYRIELGEVETQLRSHDQISDVVAAVKEKEGINFLFAYIVIEDEEKVAGLRDYLADKLPFYMIPTYFVPIEKIPLTPNGKVDRKALDVFDRQVQMHEEFIAPATQLERSIAAAWEKVLGLEEIGVNHNFFDIGGNSMNLIRVSNSLKEELGVDVPVLSLFRFTTIKALAGHIKEMQAGVITEAATIGKKEKETMDKGKNKLKNLRRRMK
jgi:acyl-coenzyme A synthetase/AMP-(fatty) acid ligase/acyl carrier protein